MHAARTCIRYVASFDPALVRPRCVCVSAACSPRGSPRAPASAAAAVRVHAYITYPYAVHSPSRATSRVASSRRPSVYSTCTRWARAHGPAPGEANTECGQTHVHAHAYVHQNRTTDAVIRIYVEDGPSEERSRCVYVYAARTYMRSARYTYLSLLECCSACSDRTRASGATERLCACARASTRDRFVPPRVARPAHTGVASNIYIRCPRTKAPRPGPLHMHACACAGTPCRTSGRRLRCAYAYAYACAVCISACSRPPHTRRRPLSRPACRLTALPACCPRCTCVSLSCVSLARLSVPRAHGGVRLCVVCVAAARVRVSLDLCLPSTLGV